MPPHLHPRSRMTTSLFTSTLMISFLVVAAPHILPCPVDPRTLADSADPTGENRRRRRRRIPEGEAGEDAMSEERRRRQLIAERLAAKRECPVPKPGGLIGQVLGVNDEEKEEQPSSIMQRGARTNTPIFSIPNLMANRHFPTNTEQSITAMPTESLTKAQRMSYRIGRGETGVLTFEPYKSSILPLWRFKNPSIARKSSLEIYKRFLEYNDQDDFIGMDMSRKFLQMGMTRAKRYANHAGGRKYDKKTGEQLEKSKGHEGMEEKLGASEAFREVWEKAKAHEGYVQKKERFMKEQKEWDREEKNEAEE
ncbi:hypothetical protein TW65_91122 [Stemphylium lycopersici]|nr:hypothetical protein TW65_91122 [Stemphylium lycopersici]